MVVFLHNNFNRLTPDSGTRPQNSTAAHADCISKLCPKQCHSVMPTVALRNDAQYTIVQNSAVVAVWTVCTHQINAVTVTPATRVQEAGA